MTASPTTQPSLLIRIRDARDGKAWASFEELYGALVHGFARRHGLQDADAADLTQDVLRIVVRAIKNWDYDPKDGSFRGWLFTVVRNELRKFIGRRRPYELGTGDTEMQSLLEAQPAREANPDASWDEEYARRLFTYAAAQVRGDFKDSTWQAFWQTGVEGKSAKQVANDLGMTVAAVYLAKSRVMARLQEHIQLLQGGRGRIED